MPSSTAARDLSEAVVDTLDALEATPGRGPIRASDVWMHLDGVDRPEVELELEALEHLGCLTYDPLDGWRLA